MDEIITNEQGGKQSKIAGMMTEVPPLGLIEVSKVMALGSKNYPREADGTPNWHKIDCRSNFDHSLEHAFNFLAEANKPDRDVAVLRDELSHYAARSLMAMEMFIKETEDENLLRSTSV
jgi:hypothetical protein